MVFTVFLIRLGNGCKLNWILLLGSNFVCCNFRFCFYVCLLTPGDGNADGEAFDRCKMDPMMRVRCFLDLASPVTTFQHHMLMSKLHASPMVVLILLIWASSARQKKLPLLQCLWCSRNLYDPLLQLLRSLPLVQIDIGVTSFVNEFRCWSWAVFFVCLERGASKAWVPFSWRILRPTGYQDCNGVWQARHNGQNYVFALLTGYREPPAGVSVSQFFIIINSYT